MKLFWIGLNGQYKGGGYLVAAISKENAMSIMQSATNHLKSGLSIPVEIITPSEPGIILEDHWEG